MSDSSMRAQGVRTLLTVAVAGILLAGCRTYGGHGSEAATYQQIQKAHQIFQEDLVRKQADLSRLEQSAGEGEVLGTLAMQYAQIVRGHEAVAAAHAEQIAHLSADSDYRSLHRVFGAVVSQQNTIRIQYEGLLTSISEAHAPEDSTVQVARPYSLIPPYYRRVENRQRNISINDVLAQVRSDSGRAPEIESTPAGGGSDVGGEDSDAVDEDSEADDQDSDAADVDSDASQ